MRASRLAWLAALAFALPACGGSGNSSGDDDGTTPDASGPAADAAPAGYTELIGRDWTIDPGETYKCVRIRVDHDIYINSFQAQAPIGTHHTVMTISDTSSPLGDYDCSAGNLDLQMLFASGVGTDSMTFPDGVAMHVAAGQYINLNLHLFNTQPSGAISGHSAIFVKTIDQSAVVNEAEMVFAGTFNINIPPNTTEDNPAIASGGCTFQHDATLLAYWPHMHQHAIHQKVTLTLGGTPDIIHDDDYSFSSQKNYPLATPIQIHAGDSIDTDCYYVNADPTNAVTFGESSTDEMCFTGLYRYPRQETTLFDCTTGSPPH